MDKEFKRMMKLAGLTEIKVRDPEGTYSLINKEEDPLHLLPILKGDKEKILDYVISLIKKYPKSFGYSLTDDNQLIDSEDGYVFATDLKDIKDIIWKVLSDETDGLGGDLIVVKD